MTNSQSDIDVKAPPFDQITGLSRLGRDRSGHGSGGHARHHLYVGRDKRTRASVLIKLTSRPGLVYQQNLENEIATLSMINQALPASRYFPVLFEHGRLRDSRTYVVMSLFDELPLAMTIGTERMPARMVSHIRTTLEVSRALIELHDLNIFHVDLNPMNILHRVDKGRPVIRIVDFESSYELKRHSGGVFYNPPTTQEFTAPEIAHRPPDARADLYSLGAVLYTMLAGYQWTWGTELGASVAQDPDLDAELKAILRTAVEADPDRRQASVRVFQAELAGYLERIWPGRSW